MLVLQCLEFPVICVSFFAPHCFKFGSKNGESDSNLAGKCGSHSQSVTVKGELEPKKIFSKMSSTSNQFAD